MKFILIYGFVISFSLVACDNTNNQTLATTMNETEKSNKNMIKDSTYFEYYDNGNKKIISDTINGNFHGQYIKFYKNENIEELGLMIHGKRNGVWKNYDEKGVLVNVCEYYNDSLLFKLDKSDFLLKSKTLEEDKVKISFPIDWVTKEKEDPFLLLVSQKKCNDSIVFCPNITLTKEKLNAEIDFNNYLQLSIDLLQERLSYFRPIAKGEILIDNLPAFQMTYLMQVEGIKLGGITTWVNDNGTVYVVTGMAINEENSEFLKYKGLFQEITNSFMRY